MTEPSDEQLTAAMRTLVAKVDLDTTGVKKFTKLLRKHFGGIQLSHRAAFIKETLTEILNENESEEEEEEEQQEEEDESEEEEEAPVAKKPKRGGGGGGLQAVKEISKDLADFLGCGRRMKRTDVVKLMWEYIKANDLQNPENKREICLDDRMKAVFGCDSFTMFTMNKYLGAHIEPYKPVDLTTSTTKPKKRKSSSGGGSAKKKRKGGGGGLSAPFQLSPELARVCGRQILPRPRVTKKLWEYIREHDLQNPNDKREILCDQKLKLVMGGNDKVTMFSMNKFIGPHLLEKLDKSYYTPSDEEEEPDEDDEE